MRNHRRLALGAAVLAAALVAAACSSGGGSGSGGTPSPAGASLASTFVFGAPPDCATNKFCAKGLQSTYGIVFKEIKSLDFGGPATAFVGRWAGTRTCVVVGGLPKWLMGEWAHGRGDGAGCVCGRARCRRTHG